MERNAFVLTLDVDSDANTAVPGRMDSLFAGAETGETRFDAAEWGTQQCLEICGELQLPSVWFLEARTAAELAARGIDWPVWARRKWFEVGCHGRCHEDFAGQVSGLPLCGEKCAEVIQGATDTIRKLTRRRPRGFRAPYNRLTPELLQALVSLDYHYDSSIPLTAARRNPFIPAMTGDPGGPALPEVHLPKLKDPAGRTMACYLWPWLEGKRKIDEYLWFVTRAMELAQGGIIQLGVHPWHLAVDAAGNYFNKAKRNRLRKEFQTLLERILALPGLQPSTIRDRLGV